MPNKSGKAPKLINQIFAGITIVAFAVPMEVVSSKDAFAAETKRPRFSPDFNRPTINPGKGKCNNSIMDRLNKGKHNLKTYCGSAGSNDKIDKLLGEIDTDAKSCLTTGPVSTVPRGQTTAKPGTSAEKDAIGTQLRIQFDKQLKDVKKYLPNSCLNYGYAIRELDTGCRNFGLDVGQLAEMDDRNIRTRSTALKKQAADQKTMLREVAGVNELAKKEHEELGSAVCRARVLAGYQKDKPNSAPITRAEMEDLLNKLRKRELKDCNTIIDNNIKGKNPAGAIASKALSAIQSLKKTTGEVIKLAKGKQRIGCEKLVGKLTNLESNGKGNLFDPVSKLDERLHLFQGELAHNAALESSHATHARAAHNALMRKQKESANIEYKPYIERSVLEGYSDAGFWGRPDPDFVTACRIEGGQARTTVDSFGTKMFCYKK